MDKYDDWQVASSEWDWEVVSHLSLAIKLLKTLLVAKTSLPTFAMIWFLRLSDPTSD
jgi:hypothetical protein